MTNPLHIEKLQRTHAVENFTCGQPELDRFLIRHALQAQQMNSSQTYVGLSDQTIIGYYTIVAGEVRHSDAPERIVKEIPRHPTRFSFWHVLLYTVNGKAVVSVPDCSWMH